LHFHPAWNDFLFSVVLTRPAKLDVYRGTNNISGGQIVPWNLQMAASLFGCSPTLLVYICLGRYVLRGMMAGSLKG
jgi:glucose/mannose transport system permease protein